MIVSFSKWAVQSSGCDSVLYDRGQSILLIAEPLLPHCNVVELGIADDGGTSEATGRIESWADDYEA